jgi:ketosteroid isomerase-like protein
MSWSRPPRAVRDLLREMGVVSDLLDVAELRRRIERLESLEAIKQLQIEYANACDDGLDADRIATLFAEDGVWEGGSPPARFTGRDEIREHFVEAKSRLRWSYHFMVGPRIELDEAGEAAYGSWYLLEPAMFAEGTALRSYWLASTYEMEYVRGESGRWCVRRMTLKPPARAPYEHWE